MISPSEPSPEVDVPSFGKRLGVSIVSTAITALLAFLLTMLSAEVLIEYGLGLFVLMPVVCGMITVRIFNHQGIYSLGQCTGMAFMAGMVTLLGFLLTGLEGLICLVMAFPIVMPLFLLGGLIGFNLCKRRKEFPKADVLILLLLLATPGWMGFEATQEKEPFTRQVTTRVIIEGTPEEVWQEVIAFSPIPEPRELVFRAGIAYPTHARIEGEGVGAIRYCEFSTGAFVEPITHWEVGKRLAFDVSEQPLPMTEISPYVGIHPPHLDWAIQSERGEFLIQNLGDGRVMLSGTTWFHVQMGPEPYWSWWSGMLIHKIHRRVLGHIRDTIEL